MQDKYQKRMCMGAVSVSDTLLSCIFNVCKVVGRETRED